MTQFTLAFTKKTKMTLIDQQDDPDPRENVTREIVGREIPNFAKPETKENAARGFHRFIFHLKLHSRRHIVDDALFLQVETSQPSNTNSTLEGWEN